MGSEEPKGEEVLNSCCSIRSISSIHSAGGTGSVVSCVWSALAVAGIVSRVRVRG
jgi:hypothetical protein